MATTQVQNGWTLIGASYREATTVDVVSTDATTSDVVTRDVDS